MKPRPVTIGLPVFNGALYLRESLESTLGQDFGDFELIISDNASTDATPEICREFAARDPRVRIHRNPTNIGMIGNFNLTASMAQSPYFMWTSHDDILAPEYVGRCYDFMRRQPDYVLCASRNALIDGQGVVESAHTADHVFDDDDLYARVSKLLANIYLPTFVYGLLRTEAVKKTPPRLTYPPDWVFALELCMQGKLFQFDEVMRYYRRAAPATPLTVRQEVEGPFRAVLGKEPIGPFPWLRVYWIMMKVIGEKPLPAPVKLRLQWTVMTRLDLAHLLHRTCSTLVKRATYQTPAVYERLRRARYSLPDVFTKIGIRSD